MSTIPNPAREKRILDATSSLIIHYGYDKTSVSDIAKEAGISKGAIYLHFKSKDDLFEALLKREMKAHSLHWIELTEADPQGGTLAGMYKNTLYALSASPFMQAMLQQDARVLGSYLQKPDNYFRRASKNDTRHLFVKMMQDAGAMRTDIDAKVIAHIMNMLAYSLVGIKRVMDAEQIPPVADVIEGVAEIMDRALTPPESRNSEAGKAVVRQLLDAAKAQLELEEAPQDTKETEE